MRIPIEPDTVQATAATVCRLAADGARWRVMVESWEERDGFEGRLVFEPDGHEPVAGPRFGPAQLRGSSREEVFAAAHELPERRIRELLHSLG